MSYIIYGRQENETIHSEDIRDQVFGFDLTEDAVVAEMVDPLLHTQGMIDANFTWYVFNDGKRLSPEQTDALVKLACEKATEVRAEWQRKAEEEMKKKAAEAEEKDRVRRRQLYERLKLEFEEAKQ